MFYSLSGLIWSEIKQLWDVGLREYVGDMWNVIDFITNALYVATVALRIVSFYQVSYSDQNTNSESLKKLADQYLDLYLCSS